MYLPIHSFCRSYLFLVHSFAHSRICSVIHLLGHSFAHWCISICFPVFISSLIHSLHLTFAAFTRLQSIVVSGDFIGTDWTEVIHQELGTGKAQGTFHIHL